MDDWFVSAAGTLAMLAGASVLCNEAVYRYYARRSRKEEIRLRAEFRREMDAAITARLLKSCEEIEQLVRFFQEHPYEQRKRAPRSTSPVCPSTRASDLA